ncbi:hypothetical protein AC578_1862 [Pseudocercospora eumusae]|uniref:Uncharacterized protein n=1 Tax=Pseudocercospora eumusae TaxID=321146 RepID=A0A139GYK8_9PEZI|nr:hypothetical protein AC578_1862 [Pseudocercospora eumusae]
MDRNTKPKARLPLEEKQPITTTKPDSRIPILKSATHSRPRYCPIQKRNTRRWGVAMLSEENMKILSTTTARLSYDLNTLAALEGHTSPRSSSAPSEHSNSSSGSIPIMLNLHHMLDTAIAETTSGASEHAKQQPGKPTRREALETIDEDTERQEQDSLHDSLLKDINDPPNPPPIPKRHPARKHAILNEDINDPPTPPPIPKRHPARKRTTLLTLKEMLATAQAHPKPKNPVSLLNAIASGHFDSDFKTIQTYIHTSARLGKTSAEVARVHMVKAEKAAGEVDVQKGFFDVSNLMWEWNLVAEGEAREELEEKKSEYGKMEEGVEVLLRVGRLGVY